MEKKKEAWGKKFQIWVSNPGAAWVPLFPAADTEPPHHHVVSNAGGLPMVQHHGHDLQHEAAPTGCRGRMIWTIISYLTSFWELRPITYYFLYLYLHIGAPHPVEVNGGCVSWEASQSHSSSLFKSSLKAFFFLKATKAYFHLHVCY